MNGSEVIKIIWIASFAFMGGILLDRGGYVPIDSEHLALTGLALPVIVGVPIVGYVLVCIFLLDKRKEKRQV